jgi:hypothetical protein
MESRSLVGVMPPGFVYPDGSEAGIWLPDAVPPANTLPSRNPGRIRLIGRLKAGITIERLRS